MHLSCPCTRLLREGARLIECHFRRELLHGDRGGVQWDVRIGGFVVAAEPAQLLAPRIPPS
jgi:hypothetical protein